MSLLIAGLSVLAWKVSRVAARDQLTALWLQGAVILAAGPEIRAEDLGLPAPRPVAGGQGGLLAQRERETILAVLEEVGGNRRLAAERLGISLRTLQYRLREYGLTER